MLSGKIFLITGATGRLGCDIVTRLEELNAVVFPIVLKGYPAEPKRIKWAARTKPIIINKMVDLENLSSPNYVINLHWRVNRSLSFSEQLLYEIDQNIHSISFLWEWLTEKSFDRFVNISSIKVFSHLNKNKISADTEPLPVSPYGIAKLTAEKFFDAYFCSSPIMVSNIRLCSVASIGEHPSQLMSQIYTSIFKKRRITLNANHITNLIYIDDAVDLTINAAIKGKQKNYLVVSEGRQNREIAEAFERISQKNVIADYVDLMPGISDPIFLSDISKLESEWTRKTPLENIIKKLIDHQK